MTVRIREGGCACGKARYRFTGEPIMVHNCHCQLCQRQTGSTSVFNVFTESENLELLSGELDNHTLAAGSGGNHTIFRCSDCGTALWSEYPRFGSLMKGFRGGTLDDAGSITPDVAIWTDFKLPWVTLPEGIPAFGEYYDFREVLSEESQQRLFALAERHKAGEG